MSHSLYKELILDHSKHPKNFGKLDNATHTAEGYNPLCGDHYFVELILNGDNITDIRFHGDGCAISKASASVMTQVVLETSKDEALKSVEQFQAIITGELEQSDDEYMNVFSSLKDFPTRTKCGALPWHTLKEALKQ